jgi:phosphoribosylamine--glycine ligase
MRVLVLGSGGREHALVWAIGRSPLVDDVICAPGSDGIARHARVLPLLATDPGAVAALAKHEGADLVVIGPEDPLAAGVADALDEAGIPAFGPSRAAAQLEASKEFAKEFMARHGIPTATHRAFSSADEADRYVDAQGGPIVVKADGLAAGKGVFVCDSPEDAHRAIDEIMREERFGTSGARVVIEERLRGEEASYYAICDGERFVCLAPAQDFKRALDGDAGENTGGMGSYSPPAVVTPEVERQIVEQVVRPTFDGMRSEGTPFRGVLYVGLMIRDGRPKVIEYNVRFGDPEAQAILYRLESDLVPLLLGAAWGRLPDDAAVQFGAPAVCVVMASDGYPRSYPRDLPIDGLEADDHADCIVFHSGTRRGDEGWLTAGGRVLGVTARAPTLALARERAYRAVQSIRWKGAQWRTDIAGAASAQSEDG